MFEIGTTHVTPTENNEIAIKDVDEDEETGLYFNYCSTDIPQCR